MKQAFPTLSDIAGKRVAVFGFGVEGAETTKFLLRHGAEVTVIDDKPEEQFPETTVESLRQEHVRVLFGVLPEELVFDAVVRSPGIKPTHPLLVKARSEGIATTSATQLFLDFCPVPVIGVTGTKGKGTTSSLITEMLRAGGKTAYLGGNIGVPALSFLDQLKPDDGVVLELSSFQLMDLETSPHIAVVLMVTMEHQDYHPTPEEYVFAKGEIVSHQQAKDYMVINQDYENSVAIGTLGKGTAYEVSTRKAVKRGSYVKDGQLLFRKAGKTEQIMPLSDIFIPGTHNWENACAAACAARLAGVPSATIARVLRTFRGLVHRLEYVREVGGVRYYDDSFSTTPETAVAALAAFSEPKILILGGSSKRSDFTELGKALAASTSLRSIIGIGVEWQRIKQAIPKRDIPVIEGCQTMQQIVDQAVQAARPGDVVVLSPACASFDMFKNYKERGDQFKKAVLEL